MEESLLRDRDFGLVAGAVGLSALGDWVAIVALGLHVKRHPAAVGADDQPPRARDGVAFLFKDRLLALVMSVAFGSPLFMSAVWVAELRTDRTARARTHEPRGVS